MRKKTDVPWFNRSVVIGGKSVGGGEPVFIVAEAGVNHFGDMDKARNLVDLAKDAGADALKIQVFRTEGLISSESEEWRSRMKSKELTDGQIRRIRAYCEEREILFFATAHDEESLDLLASMDLPAHKIGSGEVDNPKMIDRVARLGKPLILSTGMHTLEDVARALDTIRAAGHRDVVVLHCVTRYPTPPHEANLLAMETLRKRFDLPVGYSDHTEGHDISLAAAALGACLIEKHITLDRDVPNAQDWKVACGPEDFPGMIRSVRRIEEALGSGEKRPGEEELKAKIWARKSLVARIDIPQGTVLREEMIVAKRPGTGIAPMDMKKVLGKRVLKAVPRDKLILWEHLE
ncbi:MAG: N-acetylneuraminate synthase family protein [Pseudomonadota bacterium]